MKVISIGFFLPSEEEPVVWRGPMLHKALEQFLTDVYWGDDLEYLLIDLPPGTGDISLSLATFLPNMGMVVVTTPQPVAQKVAERAANMADKVKQRLLGVVENMSGFECAHCGELTPMFGEGGGELLAQPLEVPLLAKLPLVPEMRDRRRRRRSVRVGASGAPGDADLPGRREEARRRSVRAAASR